MKTARSIARYGELRLEEDRAARRAIDIQATSAHNRNRLRPLERLGETRLTAYTIALMGEHSDRMHAFREAPSDEVFADLEDRSSQVGKFYLRMADVPDIGRLCLRVAEDEGEYLGLAFAHEGDNYVTHSRLLIAEQRQGPTPLEVQPGTPFQAGSNLTVVEMGSVSEGTHIQVGAAARLEDRVETLRVISGNAGIEIPATPAPAP